jgi:hypothetical protein
VVVFAGFAVEVLFFCWGLLLAWEDSKSLLDCDALMLLPACGILDDKNFGSGVIGSSGSKADSLFPETRRGFEKRLSRDEDDRVTAAVTIHRRDPHEAQVNHLRKARGPHQKHAP